MKISSRPPLLPPKVTSAKLFVVGSTVGPLVDSLHNQCLLTYDFSPIIVPNPVASSGSDILSSVPPLFCSSWAVPPLLGVAYIVLGYILPRLIQLLTDTQETSKGYDTHDERIDDRELKRIKTVDQRSIAIFAVASTALIIKLSAFLQTHEAIVFGNHQIILDAKTNLGIMIASDLIQWGSSGRQPHSFWGAFIRVAICCQWILALSS
mmetsp:Transcript_10269/g.22840  ORF Transcript_10269/g.22840 Transcript_10269/m.22840 type:complete len:208 (-) Transcript_10269:371-994(-)